jgi:hypothetical protein
VAEEKILTEIFRPEVDDVTRDCRKLLDEELQNSNFHRILCGDKFDMWDIQHTCTEEKCIQILSQKT